jgi:16S rRNA (cytosine967-C5)-methyltransferase
MQPTTAMMQAATAAVDLALPMLHPADAVLRNFFTANRSLGQRDRAFIAETVFSVLRHKRLLEELAAQSNSRKLVCAALIKLQGYSLGQIEPFLNSGDREWALGLRSAVIETLPPAVRLSLPQWLYERLVLETSEKDAAAFGRAMLTTAPLDLRVNSLLAEREQVLRDLRASGFDAAATRFLACRHPRRRKARHQSSPAVYQRRGRGAGRGQPIARLPGCAQAARDGGGFLRRRRGQGLCIWVR